MHIWYKFGISILQKVKINCSEKSIRADSKKQKSERITYHSDCVRIYRIWQG